MSRRSLGYDREAYIAERRRKFRLRNVEQVWLNNLFLFICIVIRVPCNNPLKSARKNRHSNQPRIPVLC